jgi:SNF2 family DNA or RNA helicase
MDSALVSYTPRLKLWDHQEKALDLLLQHPVFALLMEMRTGKTATILAEFGYLEAGAISSSLLVIAPAGVYRVWEDDAKKHLAENLLKRTKFYTWVSGKAKSKKETLEREKFLAYRGPRVLMMNVEALQGSKGAKKPDPDKNPRQLCLDFLRQGPTTLVVDESTCIKGHDAKQSRFVVEGLAHLAKRRRILSGLPSPNNPLDLYQQFAFLDQRILGHMSFYSFRARYAVMKKIKVPPFNRMVDVVVGYRDVEDIRDKIAPHAFRQRLADCYDLPPKMYLRHDVEMSEEQAKIYASIKEFACAALGGEHHVTATMVITQMMRLHQVLCGHTVSDAGVVVDIKERRTAELLEVLEETREDGKAVVWVTYDADVKKVSQAIREKFGATSVARFWGGNFDEREEEERRFKEDPSCRFMVATPAAGGRGRNWAVADLNVYYSNSYSLEHRAQSEERPQAVGKTQSVAYVDLICRGTVEEKIIAALRNKIDLATAITGDDYREWLI